MVHRARKGSGEPRASLAGDYVKVWVKWRPGEEEDLAQGLPGIFL